MFNTAPSSLMKSSALFLVLLMSLLMYSSAQGHSVSIEEKLMNETILPGQVLTKQPGELHVPFETPIRVISISLTHSSGEDVDVVSKTGRAKTKMLVLVPPPLKNGKYTLEWRSLSRDGHSRSEKREFNVNIDN